MKIFTSSKVFSGYSTCFRQWRADSHCKYLHGYALEFHVTFQGPLDHRNWVMDFGSFKRNEIKEWLEGWFDHTTVIADDDPLLSNFQELNKIGAIQLRVMDNVGCEMFAEFVYKHINDVVEGETGNRVHVKQVTCHEHQINAASYIGF
jgi:6-pyruvoyltetrahydropterin/6-carboxytetrahydropterin synthase